MTEKELFKHLQQIILVGQNQVKKPFRIAINGVEGTGKTVFAEKLTDYLNNEALKAIHISIDGFHFNRAIRYRQGRNSAIGYYEDSYDENAFVEKVLKSSQLEKPHYTPATHDLETDKYLHLPTVAIQNDTILITDGAYLFKPCYREHWDLKIYLKTSFEIAMRRGIERDRQALGGFEQAKEKFESRYHKASRIYLTENDPENIADLVIDNSDFNDLKIIRSTY